MVKSKFKFLCSLMMALVLVGCSSGNKGHRYYFRDLFHQGDFKGALAVLRELDIYKDEKSKLLALMEEGMVHHAAGNFYQSLQSLEKAKTLADQLFTTSVSAKIASAVANDTFDVYYGAHYERSLIHFYLALNHFLLYQTGKYEAFENVSEKVLTEKERNDELWAARAEIVLWDSVLKSFKNDRLGKSVFKDDMMAKVFGGFIHECMGRKVDDEVALQLYKDAKDLLFKNYNAYLTFNEWATKFKKDFSKLHEMDLGAVQSSYVKQTLFAEQLRDYLDYKILTLTKVLRPRQFKAMAKTIAAKEEVINRAQAYKKNQGKLTLVLQKGLIPPKVPDRYSIGLEGAMRQTQDNEVARIAVQIGATALTLFAAEKLGLFFPGGHYWPGAHLGVQMTALAVETAGINFELPKVENYLSSEEVWVEVLDGEGKTVTQVEAPVLDPLGDIAEEAVAEDSVMKYFKVGARVAAKHIVAIATAFTTYQLLNKNGKNDFWATNAAILEYMAASKLIDYSEKADVRYWSTLPKSLQMAELSLPGGQYQVRVHIKGPDNVRSLDLGQVVLEEGKNPKLLNVRF